MAPHATGLTQSAATTATSRVWQRTADRRRPVTRLRTASALTVAQTPTAPTASSAATETVLLTVVDQLHLRLQPPAPTSAAPTLTAR